MVKPIRLAVAITVFCIASTMTHALVDIQTVPVGNPGNSGEWSGQSYGGWGPDRVCGAVDYSYAIGKYEVTSGQYTAFLNAVAKADSYGLYASDMWSNEYGCNIQRSGVPGSYTYSVASDWSKRPANFIDWGDAARFVNWLHNGQPTGTQNQYTTEDGAYTLGGAVDDNALLTVQRNGCWTWAIPTEDEWYKAAYHKNDGATGNYFKYPTCSGDMPSLILTNPDSGNIATFRDSSRWTIGSPYWRTEVGEHESSASPYGTFDQGGNVREWNECVFDSSHRCLRGGSFSDWGHQMHSSERDAAYPAIDCGYYIGFRVVQVPEPSMFVAFLAGSVAAFGPFRRRILSS